MQTQSLSCKNSALDCVCERAARTVRSGLNSNISSWCFRLLWRSCVSCCLTLVSTWSSSAESGRLEGREAGRTANNSTHHCGPWYILSSASVKYVTLLARVGDDARTHFRETVDALTEAVLPGSRLWVNTVCQIDWRLEGVCFP